MVWCLALAPAAGGYHPHTSPQYILIKLLKFCIQKMYFTDLKKKNRTLCPWKEIWLNMWLLGILKKTFAYRLLKTDLKNFHSIASPDITTGQHYHFLRFDEAKNPLNSNRSFIPSNLKMASFIRIIVALVGKGRTNGFPLDVTLNFCWVRFSYAWISNQCFNFQNKTDLISWSRTNYYFFKLWGELDWAEQKNT